MFRRRLEVLSVCPAWWLLVIIFFSSSASAASVQSQENQQQSLASKVPFIMNLLKVMPKKEWHVEEIQKNCPQLWSLNETIYKNDRLKGVLGSLDDMKKYCLPNETLSPSPACQGAIGISDYVCQAMTTMSNLEQPLFPLDKAISEKLALKGGLCEILSDVTFLETICLSMPKAAISTLQYDCDNLKNSESFKDRCSDFCAGEGNNRACEIILQSLRTITYWEKQKDKAAATLKEDGAPTAPGSSIPSSSSSQGNTAPPAAVSKLDQTTSTPSSRNNTLPSDVLTKVNNSSSAAVSSNSSVSSPNTTSSKNETLTPPSSPIPVTSVKPSDTTRLPVALEDQGPKDEPKLFDNNPDDLEPEEEAYPLERPEKTSPSTDEDPAFEEDNADKNMEDSVIAPAKPGSPIYDTRIPDVDDGPVNTHFLFYFLAFVVLSVTSYIVYQRRNRIIAMVVEGRSGPSSSGRRRSSSTRGERPSSGSYRKLVNNLEEAITSHSVKNSNVIY